MNVGFYYHVEAVFDPDGTARVPALFGLFVDELAKHAGHVTFYAHGQSTSGIEDHSLREPLVTCVDLGPRRSFPERLMLPGRSLRAFTPGKHGVDVMLVRGPSPLLPHVARASGDIPVAVHIVGDYTDQRRRAGARTMPVWRQSAIRVLFRAYTRWQRRVARNALVLVNTPDLARRFGEAEVVFESTLTEDMVVAEPRAAENGLAVSRPARLLYTGRIIPEKGLWEAAEAVRILTDRGLDVTLDVVGWEQPADPVVERLRAHIRSLDIEARVRFAGYVPAGLPLATVYRKADVFVLPTHGEGFPRSLFEAMGSGLPVVTTAVGGIPHWIRHDREAVLVQPRSASSLADGLERLLTDDDLRQSVARAGWEFARPWTVQKGCELLATKLADWSRASGRAPTPRT